MQPDRLLQMPRYWQVTRAYTVSLAHIERCGNRIIHAWASLILATYVWRTERK